MLPFSLSFVDAHISDLSSIVFSEFKNKSFNQRDIKKLDLFQQKSLAGIINYITSHKRKISLLFSIHYNLQLVLMNHVIIKFINPKAMLIGKVYETLKIFFQQSFCTKYCTLLWDFCPLFIHHHNYIQVPEGLLFFTRGTRDVCFVEEAVLVTLPLSCKCGKGRIVLL